MKKLTREEIEKRLEILRESRLNEESFTITEPYLFACCYVPAPRPLPIRKRRSRTKKLRDYLNNSPEIKDLPNVKDLPDMKSFNCSICKKHFEVKADKYNKIPIIKKIVERFCEAGVEAKLIYSCDECAAKSEEGAQFAIKIKADGEEDWHTSIPTILNTEYKGNYCLTSEFEYELALKFLTIQEKIDDLN